LPHALTFMVICVGARDRNESPKAAFTGKSKTAHSREERTEMTMVSVIIPTYNRAALVLEAVASVLLQKIAD
ncbi:MAG TPA: hypothetical protein DEO88_11195, partial [Syntrophobacteraceae bacterium]|nr:hypothetical protein [Syntrophobacteraceae bacterium]